ncbi:MAG: transporter substrate-binding domain-containing protein [Casimicrobiaceae bacterium]
MSSTKLAGLTAALLGMLMLVLGAAADAQSVNDIVKRGKVRIGVNSGAPPFSVVDAKGNPVGYDVDVAHVIAKYLGVPVEIIPYTTPARIPALESGKVDMVIATLSPTPERARAVMFTMPYSTFQLVVVAPKNSTIKSLADLAGKKVGVSRGTPQEVALTRSAPKSTQYARFDDDSTTMQSLVSHQVDAIAIPETVFKEVQKAQPQTDLQVKFTFFNQFMSMAVRLDAFELRQWLNTTLSYIKTDGELDDISKKWTGNPLPSTMPVF